jgi:hypothetical protein
LIKKTKLKTKIKIGETNKKIYFGSFFEKQKSKAGQAL